MLAVLQTTELAQLILGHCGCNSLANFALCNKFSYSLVSGFFTSRLRIILGLFLPDKATQLRFLRCLDSLRSFIAGSAAFWFLNPRASFAFDNMNIICPVGTHHEWVSFFASLSMPRLRYVEPAGHFNRHTSSTLHYRSSQVVVLQCTPYSSLNACSHRVIVYRFISAGLIPLPVSCLTGFPLQYVSYSEAKLPTRYTLR